MTTALEIIDRALEHIGVKAAGEATSAEDADVGLRAMTSLLDALQADHLNVVGLTELTYTPSAGDSQVTIGASGADITASMPAWLSAASHYRISGVDYPLPLADSFEQYAAFPSKAQQGRPEIAFYMRGSTTGTLYLGPAADGTFQLRLWVPPEVISGQSTLSLSGSLSMPAGYRALLEYGVALELCPTFERPDSVLARMEQRYTIALRRIKRSNTQVPQLESQASWHTYFDIEAGQ